MAIRGQYSSQSTNKPPYKNKNLKIQSLDANIEAI